MSDLKARIEAGLPGIQVWQGAGCVTATAPTGEKFVSIDILGVQPKTWTKRSKPSLTREAAETLLIQRVKDYAAGKSGTLYWRRPPLNDLSCRLLISDKPVMANHEDEFSANRLNDIAIPEYFVDGPKRFVVVPETINGL